MYRTLHIQGRVKHAKVVHYLGEQHSAEAVRRKSTTSKKKIMLLILPILLKTTTSDKQTNKKQNQSNFVSSPNIK